MNRVPPIVDAFVRRCVRGSVTRPRGTLLQQRGEMRLGPDGPWRPFTAEQTIEAHTTAFVWHARVQMAPLVTAVVEDAYEGGRGRLDANLWGLFSVAHARGIDVDRGEAQRYLAELPWCPLALLHNPELRFEEREGESEHAVVRVSIHDHPEYPDRADTHVDLTFDPDGDIVEARTPNRVRGDVVQPWAGRFRGYRDVGDGLRAPGAAEVWWEEDDGEPFVYWRGEVTSLTWR
jgi:hypothetical protein